MRLYYIYEYEYEQEESQNLSKSQLIKLLLKQDENGQAQKQIANEFENSIVPQPNQEESLPGKSVNNYKPPEQFRDRQKK